MSQSSGFFGNVQCIVLVRGPNGSHFWDTFAIRNEVEKYGKNHWDVPWTGLTTNRAPPCSTSKNQCHPQTVTRKKWINTSKHLPPLLPTTFATPPNIVAKSIHLQGKVVNQNSNQPTNHPPTSARRCRRPRLKPLIISKASALPTSGLRMDGWGGWWMGGSTKDGCGLAFLNKKINLKVIGGGIYIYIYTHIYTHLLHS